MSTPCAVCKEGVTKKRAPGVQCNGKCKLFFHFDCAKLSEVDIQTIERKSFDYKCKACRNGRQSLVFARRDSVSSDTSIAKPNEKIEEKNELQEIKERQIEIKYCVFRLEEIVTCLNNKIDENLKILVDSIQEIANKVDINLTKNLDKKMDENIKSVKEAMESVSNKSLSKIMKEMDKVVDKVERSDEQIEIVEQQRRTYSEKLKSKPASVLIITPKDPGQTSSTTQDFVRNTIDPGVIPIRNMRQKSNGKVLVECANKNDEEQIKNLTEAALGEGYEVKIPAQLKPRIKIVGLSQKLSIEEVQDNIIRQNDFIGENSSLQVVQVKENRLGNGYWVIAEVDGICYNRCMQTKRINIKWDRCRVYDNINIRRCFNCAGYNHLASYCKNRKACMKCGEAHDMKNCESVTEKCRNCEISRKRFSLSSFFLLNKLC